MLSTTHLQRVRLMSEKAPYRLQVFLPEEWRIELRQAAHEEYTSVQKLMESILRDYLDTRKKKTKPGESAAKK